MNIEFTGPILVLEGPLRPGTSSRFPAEQCDALRAIAGAVTYGWGMIPVTGQIDDTRWTTSLFPKDGQYIVPIKASVRRAENLEEGDVR
ncbi:MAG: DUF1905 domain-containing protein [Caldilineaceae bacterium]